MGKAGKTVRSLLHFLGEEIVRDACVADGGRGIAFGLHTRPGDRQHARAMPVLSIISSRWPPKSVSAAYNSAVFSARHRPWSGANRARSPGPGNALPGQFFDHDVSLGRLAMRYGRGFLVFICIAFWANVYHDARRPNTLRSREFRVEAYRVSASMNRQVSGPHVTNDKSQVQVIARAATILRALEEENAG